MNLVALMIAGAYLRSQTDSSDKDLGNLIIAGGLTAAALRK